jgi:hypothetical protein
MIACIAVKYCGADSRMSFPLSSPFPKIRYCILSFVSYVTYHHDIGRLLAALQTSTLPIGKGKRWM